MWAAAAEALLAARAASPPREMHVALGVVPPPVAAQAIVDSLKTRGCCACDAGAEPALLQAALREALTCMQVSKTYEVCVQQRGILYKSEVFCVQKRGTLY